NVSTVQMSLASSQFDRTDHVAQLVRGVKRRLAGIRGVSAVGSTSSLPLERSLTMPFTIAGRDQRMVGRYHGTATWLSVSPGYFDTLRIILLRGRKFTEADGENSPGVVMINRALLTKYWQEEG